MTVTAKAATALYLSCKAQVRALLKQPRKESPNVYRRYHESRLFRDLLAVRGFIISDALA